ncbi:YfhO family protein [Chryseolinea sp. H1M3-3]|uniref:YfhO family protein n=1 Tax=Chryseolinea sp. H1M3-3 TaxID=3034144 RepID=UPI0023EBB590|nr:YfhO family protein [Chryseolinea sp. H1M3-3]
MKKINFSKDVLPHAIAIGVFLIVTVFFFNPVFFDNKVLDQQDITQWEGSSKAMRDYRAKTGDEPLWTPSMFSGMPGYLVNVEWGNGAVSFLKSVLAVSLPHPIANIYLAFISYYIMLLAFGVRPYLAIAGALAFGLSSYLIVGLNVGHSSRIGAIAFMPLVMAGVHLIFSNNKILGFGVTTAGLALHLRENHLQMTYYLLLILIAYGIMQLVVFIKQNKTPDFFKAIAWLVPASIIAIGTFIAPMWAVLEYSTYSRGKSELVSSSASTASSGVNRDWAFAYNYAIDEPMTLLVPSYYGGTSQNLFVQDRESETYKALARNGDEKMFNQLAYYSGAYWGPSTPFPYYAGAIIVFLFVLGIIFVEKKYVWWLVFICILATMMSWGSNFSTFNYFIFDYLPGYNKFRSFTFAVVMILIAMPLLGFIAVEKVLTEGLVKPTKKKLLVAFGIVGGICLLLLLFAGMFSFIKDGEEAMPPWFISALADDRKSLLRSDAFRSFVFITLAFVVLYFEIWNKLAPVAFYSFLIAIVLLDVAVVDARFLTKDDYKRKRENTFFTLTEADQEILKDKSYYRVYNLQDAFAEARTSYFHNSIGGYHGVKLRRYQDLYDTCLARETNELIQDASSGNIDFRKYGVINMLNAKYLVYGGGRDNIIPNASALGNAWFVSKVETVNSPTEELTKVCDIDTRTTAVVDGSKFKVADINFDSSSSIKLIEHTPNYLKYESQSAQNGLAVFSEIYYPKGWIASIDGKESEIIRANYILRALVIPSGKHTVEFKFKPAPYVVGNKITMVSSWLMLLVVLGCIGWSMKK